MTTIKQKAVSTKKFVAKHRVAIAVTLTSALWIKVLVLNAEQLNEFLKEHDLYDTYYAMDEE